MTTHELWERVWKQAPLNHGGPTDHGLKHWKQVEANVMMLAAKTTGADIYVGQLFALFHDCRRDDEWQDVNHGRRGSDFARDCRVKGWFELTEWQMRQLTFACIDHEKGETHPDPTIAVCWDADRLDLPRVNIIPHPKYMSTEHGKKLAKELQS